jgi:hypothetical protein
MKFVYVTNHYLARAPESRPLVPTSDGPSWFFIISYSPQPLWTPELAAEARMHQCFSCEKSWGLNICTDNQRMRMQVQIVHCSYVECNDNIMMTTEIF